MSRTGADKVHFQSEVAKKIELPIIAIANQFGEVAEISGDGHLRWAWPIVLPEVPERLP